MGTPGNTSIDAADPDVVWNATNNEYMVVWSSDSDIAPITDGEFEIFGQRLSNTGVELGTNDFRISFCGVDGSINFDALAPAVTWNSNANEYIIVWSGDSTTNGNDEIHAQVLSDIGSLKGTNFQISNLVLQTSTFDAESPRIVYNSTNNEYLVSYYGHYQVVGNSQVYIARLDASNSNIIFADSVISDMGD